MRKFAILFMILCQGLFLAAVPVSTETGLCCKTRTCAASITCCTPSDPTDPVPAVRTDSLSRDSGSPLVAGIATPVDPRESPRFVPIRGISVKTHSPPYFILHAALLI